MTEKPVRIGFDRFLALEWADYSLELFLSSQDNSQNYEQLKRFVQEKVNGAESARKTSNQLKRLWLNLDDEYEDLRYTAKENIDKSTSLSHPIYHYGLAINVFPIFRKTCKKIGELSEIQNWFDRNLIIDRIANDFLNPSSIPRAVTRVIQTLDDWGFIECYGTKCKTTPVLIQNSQTTLWFIGALMRASSENVMSIQSLNNTPLKIGVSITEIRNIITQSDELFIRRSSNGEEIVSIAKNQ